MKKWLFKKLDRFFCYLEHLLAEKKKTEIVDYD